MLKLEILFVDLDLVGIVAKKKMAGATGLEPATSAVTGQRSNQLSYAPLERGQRSYCNSLPGVNGELKNFWDFLLPLFERLKAIKCGVMSHLFNRVFQRRGDEGKKRIRVTDAKEVGVGNPAEETYRYPNQNPCPR